MLGVMTQSHGLAGSAPKIAIGAAVAAVLTSLVAVIVVVSRGDDAAAKASPATTSEDDGDGARGRKPSGGAAAIEKRVSAADVAKLKRENVAVVRDAGRVIGVRVTEADVRDALGLERDDVIAALSGRPLKREYDVFDAVMGISHLDATTVFVDLVRDGSPVLLRWQVDGDLRAARRADLLGGGRSGSFAGLTGGGSLSGTGGLGSLGGGLSPGGTADPFAPSRPDPLADTVTRISSRSFEVPRSTFERVFNATSSYRNIARTMTAPSRTGGFRLYAIRPGSLLAAIGLVNGDTVRALNGHEVSTPDEVVELYQQLKDAREWRIDVIRHGAPELITIAIK